MCILLLTSTLLLLLLLLPLFLFLLFALSFVWLVLHSCSPPGRILSFSFQASLQVLRFV